MSQLKVSISIKRELFRFDSFTQWVDKASSWFRECRVTKGNYIAVDSRGLVMRVGEQFHIARDRNSFPVIVYELEG